MNLRDDLALDLARRTVILKALSFARKARRFYGEKPIIELREELAALRVRIRSAFIQREQR